MDGVSADPQQKFQSAHQLCLSTKNSFRNLEIPPRQLLTRRLAALSSEPSMDMYHHYHQQIDQSPRIPPEEPLFQKFLANFAIDDDGSDPYASDEFRMYEFKVRKCTRSRSHDWTDCPFAHPDEKARRRCPRRFSYSGTVCEDFRRGICLRGDSCQFAHGVFECWLHPSRYRTEACKDGKNCQRKICFFAHNASQLRPLPPAEMVVSHNKQVNSGRCAYCRCNQSIRHDTSPTSILDRDKLSPPSSPPISPAQIGGQFSPISRFSDRLLRSKSCGMTQHGNAESSYRDDRNNLMTPQAIEELMRNMKVMNMNAIDGASSSNPIWSDSSPACDDDDNQQSFFSVSPSVTFSSAMNDVNVARFVKETPITGPDVNWVNDLLI